MKIGSFEGTTEEYKDVCENHGFTSSDFLTTPARFQPKVWALIVFVILFTILSILLWTCDLSSNWNKSLIIINLILIIIIAIVVHLRFDKWLISVITFLGGLIVLSVSLDYVTPKDAINEMKETIMKKEP
jgi:succinate-acetate transporter protein